MLGGQKIGSYIAIQLTILPIVLIAERSSLPMETKRENTAATSATSKAALVRNRAGLSKNRFAAERNYRVSRHLLESMLRSGLISSEEFTTIDTKMKEKYDPISGGLFL